MVKFSTTSTDPSNLSSGHQVEALEGEELAKQQDHFGAYARGLVRLNPGHWLFPTEFLSFAEKYYEFEFRGSDVMVMSWPKCGSTWLQEIVWTLRNNATLDHPDTLAPTLARCVFFEMDYLLQLTGVPTMTPDNPMLQKFQTTCPGKDTSEGIILGLAEADKGPRTFKTHLPFSLLPPKLLDNTKVVYIARNPLDVVLSYCHHSRLFKAHQYQGPVGDFVEFFVRNDLLYGSYGLHLQEAWEQRHHPNFCFIFYEDLKADPLAEIQRLNDFLGTDLTEVQREGVMRHCSFQEMKNRNAAMGVRDEEVPFFNQEVVAEIGGFFRKGEVGSWQNERNPILDLKMNQWIAENIDVLGLDFKYNV